MFQNTSSATSHRDMTPKTDLPAYKADIFKLPASYREANVQAESTGMFYGCCPDWVGPLP